MTLLEKFQIEYLTKFREFLEQKTAEYKHDGYVPTIDLVIGDLNQQIYTIKRETSEKEKVKKELI